MRDNSVERLFSLFTSSERAAAMAEDLAEERPQRGWTRYWLHVLTLTLALWRNASTEAPLRMIALTTLGLVLLSVPALAGTWAVLVVPGLYGSPINLVPLSLFWGGGALWVGASLATMAHQRGMAACAILAVAGTTLLLAFGAASEPTDFLSPRGLPNLTAALGATVALLAGGSIARGRTIIPVVPFAMAVALGATAVFFTAPAGSWRAVSSSTRAEHNEWRDPSPHIVKSVTVDDGVQLEVLDWGGSGPALVLLAGLGGTAHQYDDLAPALTARYRVVGVTRRGHRGSSAVLSGYGFVRLAEDVLRVIDAIGIGRPVVIGHSFAGEEMHVLGARHAARIRGLVYVDAAFDRDDDTDSETYGAAARLVPTAPSANDADRASFTALRAHLDKYGGAGPEAWLRTRYRANPDGSVAGVWAPDLPIRQAMSKEMQAGYTPYNPEPIRVPALAIYASPQSAEDLLRHGSTDRSPFPELVAMTATDPLLRERVEWLYLVSRARVQKHIRWFEAFAERGRVVELSGDHNLIVSNPREVLQQIEAFVSSLPEKP